MRRTTTIHWMLAPTLAALAALALTLGNVSAKEGDRRDADKKDADKRVVTDPPLVKTPVGKTPAIKVDADKLKGPVKNVNADKLKGAAKIDAAAVKSTARVTSVETGSTIRYSSPLEKGKGRTLPAVESVKRVDVDTSTIKRPINYGSIRNPSSATINKGPLLKEPDLGDRRFVAGPAAGGKDKLPVTAGKDKFPIAGGKDKLPIAGGLGAGHAGGLGVSGSSGFSGKKFDPKVINSHPGKVVIPAGKAGFQKSDAKFGGVHFRPGDRFTDRRPINSLPSGHQRYDWKGQNYFHRDYHWYRPYIYGGYTTYWPVYPPSGYYYNALPPGYVLIVHGGLRFYYCDDVYYQAAPTGTGYVVVDPPQDELEYAPAAPAAIDPYAVLRGMADYTTRLPRLSLTASNVFDEVTASGTKIQLADRHTLFIQRPNRLLVQVHSDTDDRVTYYDGAALTIYDARRNVFSRLPAPPGMENAVDSLARNYGISLPLAELITSDYNSLAAPLQSGQYLGLAMVGPYTCHHLAFTQDAIDWEIWIDAGAAPIPRQYAVTYKQIAEAPRFISTIQTWNDSPIAAGNLQLSLPSNAQQVEMVPVPR